LTTAAVADGSMVVVPTIGPASILTVGDASEMPLSTVVAAVTQPTLLTRTATAVKMSAECIISVLTVRHDWTYLYS
jgi:hypothetical protein